MVLLLIVSFCVTGFVLSRTLEVALGVEQGEWAWAWIGLSVASGWFLILWAMLGAINVSMDQNRIRVRLDWNDRQTGTPHHFDTMGRIIPIKK